MKKLIFLSFLISLTAFADGKITNADIFSGAAIADSKLQTNGNNTVLGNISGTATPVALTTTQLTALINSFSSSLSGAVPASGGGTTNFLRADGTFAVPAGTGISSIGAFGSSPNGNGGTISGSTLTLQPADGSNPGGVSAATQSFPAFAKTFTGQVAVSTAGAASTPAYFMTGSPFTGGSATTTKPLSLMEDAGTSSAWSTAGGYFGINAKTGFAGHLIDAQLNAVPVFALNFQGGLQLNNINDAATAGSLLLCGGQGTTGGNGCGALYMSTVGLLSFYSPAQALITMMVDVPNGRVGVGGGTAGTNTFTAKNIAGQTGRTTSDFIGIASQTADLTHWDTSTPTTVAKVDITGKGFFANLQDAGAVSGCLQADGSGNVSSTGSSCVAGTVTAVSVASGSGFAGSSSGGATPVLTLTTTINSPILAGNGTAIASATTTGSGSTAVLATGPTMTNPVVGTQATGDNSTKAASTAFVQTALAQLNPAAAVTAATTATVAGTYTNAVSGICIGDTFQVTSTAAFVVDGITLTVGQRVLLKNQASAFQNGIWTLTTAANVGVLGALLTRALDFDSSSDINSGQLIPVISGTVNAGTIWFQASTVTTCNTDTQTYTQFSSGSGGTSSTSTAAYTPTIGADFGTPSAVQFTWHRLGDRMLSQGCFTTGTLSNVTGGGIQIANSQSIDTTKIGFNGTSGAASLCPAVGSWSQDHASGTFSGNVLACVTTSATVVYLSNQLGASTLEGGNFSTIGFSNAKICMSYDVPISGWTNNN